MLKITMRDIFQHLVEMFDDDSEEYIDRLHKFSTISNGLEAGEFLCNSSENATLTQRKYIVFRTTRSLMTARLPKDV